MTSIPEISLEYNDNNIIINSKCNSNHFISIPLNEFLIKFHPLYQFFKDLNYCSKCFIKLFHYNKSSFFTHYCSLCDQYYCIHEESHQKNKHNLNIIEKDFPEINFTFPICPYCENEKYIPTIINGKIRQSTLKEIIQNFNKRVKIIKKIENDFNNIEGKIYFELYPSYEYFMRMNYLEILLCENLLKTYKLYRDKKQIYYQIMKNILNIFNFLNDNFSLNDISGKKEEIEEIKMYFMNIYNCFLVQKRYNLVFYKSVCCKEYLKKNNCIIPNSIHCINISKFNSKNIIFPDINKIFEIYNNTIIYELNNISDYKINEYVPDNISYIQNNFFIYQISNKLYIKYLNKNKILISKGIITLEKEKNYKKIFSGKKNILFCVERNSDNSDNLDLKLNDPFLIDTNIFLTSNVRTNIEILKCSDNLTNAKIISTIYDIHFMKKINNNLILYVKRNSLYFIDGEGSQIKKMYLSHGIDENKICIYKENFLIIAFYKGEFWLYDLIEFKIIYSYKFGNLYYNKFSEIENEDIVDENNNIKSLYMKSKLLSNNSKICIGCCYSNNQGCFFQYNNNNLLYLTNIEKKDNIIIQRLGVNAENLKELIFLKNENMFVLVKKNNYEFYKFNIE